MSFDISTAIPVDDKPTGVNRVGNFDISSARSVDAPSGKTDFESFQEDTRVLKEQPQKTPGLDEAIMGGHFSDVKDPGFLNSAVIATAGALQDAFVKPITGKGIISEETVQSAQEHHPVESILAGTAPFIATAPLFPGSLAGMSAQFGAVMGLSELGKQRTEESLMKPQEEKATDVIQQTAKGVLLGPIWHAAGELKFIGRPFATSLTKAGVIGAGTTTLDKVYGSNLTQAFKDGGTMTALSLIFETPSLAKTAIGRGIVAHSNALDNSNTINPEGSGQEVKQQVLDKVKALNEKLPEQKPTIVSAAVKIGDKVIDGASHEDALNKFGESKDTMKEGVDYTPMFRTSDNRLITRDQAQEEFGIRNSEEIQGLNQQKFLTPPKEPKVVNPETIKGIAEGEEGKMNVDMIPGIAETSEFLKRSSEEYTKALRPPNVGEESKFTAATLREQGGIMARASDKMESSLNKSKKFFDKANKEDSLDFIYRMERGDKQKTPELQEMAEDLRRLFDTKREEIQALGTGKLEDYIENYFPHIWDNPKKAQKMFAAFLSGKKPLSGRKEFLKKRTIESTEEGIKAGLTPVSYNPVDLAMMKAMSIDKYLLGQRTLLALKDTGLRKFVKLGGEVPEGWVKVNDNAEDVFQSLPTGELVKRGTYYTQPDAARIINNYLSPGLRGNYAYETLRTAGNALNQFQLGFSAFHLGFTSLDATISKFALGVKKLTVGDISGIKEMIVAPAAPLTNAIKGLQLDQAWHGKSQDPLMNKIADLMASAGGRAKMDKFYAIEASNQWSKNMKEGKYASNVLKVPFWIVEQASRPIMEHIVPAQKLGVFADLMKLEMERRPDATHEEMRDVAQKAWDSVDNRMGQMVYDNLFWNKTVKDIGMLSIRSLGWNIGTVREVGGGLTDVIGNLNDIRQGKASEISYRTTYVLGLAAITGLYGATYQYLATGKRPGEGIEDQGTGGVMKDLFFPRNGGVDKNGEPARVSLPSYAKDVYHLSTAPAQTVTNKLNPVFGTFIDMINNKDFYGTKIYNENDPIMQKALDESKFLLGQFEPFGVRNLGRDTRETAGSKIEPFIGITPAPYDVSMTKLERAAYDVQKSNIPVGARGKVAAKHSQEKSKVFNKFLSDGDISKVNDAVADGTITSREKKEIIKESKMSNLQRQTRNLTFEELTSIANKATDAERPELEKIMKKKKTNKQKMGTWGKEEQALYEEYFSK